MEMHPTVPFYAPSEPRPASAHLKAAIREGAEAVRLSREARLAAEAATTCGATLALLREEIKGKKRVKCGSPGKAGKNLDSWVSGIVRGAELKKKRGKKPKSKGDLQQECDFLLGFMPSSQDNADPAAAHQHSSTAEATILEQTSVPCSHSGHTKPKSQWRPPATSLEARAVRGSSAKILARPVKDVDTVLVEARAVLFPPDQREMRPMGCTATLHDKKLGKIRLKVTDTGSGIGSTVLLRDRADKRFEQVDSDVERIAGRHGLVPSSFGIVYRALLQYSLKLAGLKGRITLNGMAKVLTLFGLPHRDVAVKMFKRHLQGESHPDIESELCHVPCELVAVQWVKFRSGTRRQQVEALFFYVDVDDSGGLTFMEIHEFAQSLRGALKRQTQTLRSGTDVLDAGLPMDLKLVKAIAKFFNHVSTGKEVWRNGEGHDKVIACEDLVEAVERDDAIWEAFQTVNPMQGLWTESLIDPHTTEWTGLRGHLEAVHHEEHVVGR